MTERECIVAIAEAVGCHDLEEHPFGHERYAQAETALRKFVGELAAKHAGQVQAIDMLKQHVANLESRLHEQAQEAANFAATMQQAANTMRGIAGVPMIAEERRK